MADDEASDDAQYGTVIETDEGLAKEPPLLPPQLQLSLLNAPMDTSNPGQHALVSLALIAGYVQWIQRSCLCRSMWF